MKKALLFAIVVGVVSLTACKKDRTCTCTYTWTSGSTSGSGGSATTKYKKVKKHDVAAECVSYTETDEDGDTWTEDCKLS